MNRKNYFINIIPKAANGSILNIYDDFVKYLEELKEKKIEDIPVETQELTTLQSSTQPFTFISSGMASSLTPQIVAPSSTQNPVSLQSSDLQTVSLQSPVTSNYSGQIPDSIKKVLDKASEGKFYSPNSKKYESLGENNYKRKCTSGPSTFYKDALGINLFGSWWKNPHTATKSNLESKGFTEKWSGDGQDVRNNEWKNYVKPGDIMVEFGGGSAHAQMWNGEKWISDTVQDSAWVYRKDNGRLGKRSAVLYRNDSLWSAKNGGSFKKLYFSKNGSRLITRAQEGTQLYNPELSENVDFFTSDSIGNFYNQNKHKKYSLKNRHGINSTDCSTFATDYWKSQGFEYPEKNKTCAYIGKSKAFEDLDMYQNGSNLKVGDALLYEGPKSKHVVIYGGVDENGNHYGYESAVNRFERDGKSRNGVQILTGLQFPKQGETSYYGTGTWREGQTLDLARKDHANLKLVKIRRPITQTK